MGSTTSTIATLIDNNLADNSDIIPSEHRAVEDALNDSMINNTNTTTQDIESSLNFASGKGAQFNGGDVLSNYVTNSYTATITPSTSGSVTLTSTKDILSYTRIGNMVTVVGFLEILSTSSPVGTTINVSLPLSVIDGPELSGRSSSIIAFNAGGAGTFTQEICTVVESATSLVILKDASTLAVADQFWINFTYLTGA